MADLRVEHVTKSYGDSVALDDVSFDVRDGELVVLLGPSGCGKSTLLRVIAGLLQPDRGRLLIDGRDVTGLQPAERDVAMVFQSYALYPHFTVERNLSFGLRSQRLPKREIAQRVTRVSRQLGLEPFLRRRPRELSGGQRQRVALGRAIVREPKAFLMDEPLSNLDAQLRSSTRDEIVDLHAALGATFVYVTHDQVEAMTMADRIIVMNAGQIEQIGTPAEVYDQPATTFVSQFVGSPAMNLIDVTVQSADGFLHASGRGLELPLWPGTQAPTDLVMGVRPECFRLANAPPEAADLVVRVDSLEMLGNDEVVRANLAGLRIHIRAPRRSGLRVGECATVRLDAGDVVFFDPRSGRRVEWVDDPAGSPASPAIAVLEV